MSKYWFLVAVCLSSGLLVGCDRESGAATAPQMEAKAPTAVVDPVIQRFRNLALSAGIKDPSAYARAAYARGLNPVEALAADLTICGGGGSCPAGVTRDDARGAICTQSGDMCT